MSQWDTIYCELCQKILEEGTRVSNRTGVDTIKIPAAHFELNLEEEFPILTTKQLFIRQAVLEMLWIYQVQSNDVRWLQERMYTYGIYGKSMKTETGVMKRQGRS